MKKLLAALLALHWAFVPAYAQNAVKLPIAAAAVADIGNGPIKVRVVAGNASIFTAQGSGVGSTSGASTLLTLTGVPATPPCIGCILSGSGITSGTTVTAYDGATSVTMSAAMVVPASTSVAWGAACPASASGIPSQYIPASVMADYYLLYTQARVCAISPGGPVNTLLILPIFYDTTTAGGGSNTVTAVFGRTGAIVATAGDYSFSLLSGSLGCAQLPAFTGDVTNVACALTVGAAKITAAMLAAGAAASNVGTLGGVLSGTLPNPGWANVAANTVLSNWTAGSAAPVFNTWPACANDGTHALVYVNGSGLACATITTSSGVTSVTIVPGSGITASGTCVITTTGTCTLNANIATNSGAWTASALALIDAAVLNSAGSSITLTDASPIVLNMATFIDAEVTLAGNRTLGNPTNTQPGRTGCIYIIQDGTGSRTLIYASNWKFPGGTAPTLTTTPGAVDTLCYKVRTPVYVWSPGLNKALQ